jgi:hypothetical protein
MSIVTIGNYKVKSIKKSCDAIPLKYYVFGTIGTFLEALEWGGGGTCIFSGRDMIHIYIFGVLIRRGSSQKYYFLHRILAGFLQ